MKIIFMGTPDFSVQALESLIEAGHEVIAVYTKAPRPAGRGQKEMKSPVHLAAEKHNIPVNTPKTLKDIEVQAEFAALGADVAVVAAYGLILPKTILDICPCINIHASLLPRWRGAAPIQRAILAGDKTSGVTIMQMDEGLDTGDMLIWEEIPIQGMSAGELHDSLATLGAKLVVSAMDLLKKGELKPIRQTGEATYADKIKKEEAFINWNKPGAEIIRQINGFNPFPGAYFNYKDEKIKILAAKYKQTDPNAKPGTIVDNMLSIACLDGVLHPKTVQRQGKKPMPAADMLRGYNIEGMLE
jgi:methionyl-tRNA formyltransferase